MDHPLGCPCWDSDVGSLSVFTVEGKSRLSLEISHINFTSCFLKNEDGHWHICISFFHCSFFSPQ